VSRARVAVEPPEGEGVALYDLDDEVGFDDEDGYADGSVRPSRRDRRRARRAARAEEKAATAPRGFTPPPPDPDDDDGPRQQRWPRIVLVAALILLGVLLVAAGINVVVDRSAGPAAKPSHRVPPIVGLDESEARKVLAEFKWEINEERARRDDSVAGEVLEVRPGPRRDLQEGATITLVVSEGTLPRAVPPEVIGRPVPEAEMIVVAAGLVPQVTEEHHEEVPAGTVIRLADGTPPELFQNDPVGLVASIGPKPRTVPTGLPLYSLKNAEEKLAAVQLKAETVQEYSDIDLGLVIRVPAEGTEVSRGSAVQVVVSKGPEPRPVPDVSGAGSLAAAVDLLEGAGFVPGSVTGPAQGRPVRTDPAAGTAIQPGRTVNIVLG
jgi:serine/threonine-protein kinase